MYKRRILSLFAIVALSVGASGCADSLTGMQDMLHDFNPMGSGKKKLTGDRRAMFPEGVPGVQQGVPPELLKGAPQEEPVAVPVVATPEPKARTRRVRTAKPAAAPRTARVRRAPAEEPGAAGAGWTEPPQRQAPAATPARQAAPAQQSGWGPPPNAAAPSTAWPDPPKSQ